LKDSRLRDIIPAMPLFLGELAALTTAALWSGTATFFTLAGRRLGSTVVNRWRLLLAVLFISLAHLALFGSLVPLGAEPWRWLWFGLSGIVGLVLGDAFLFQSFLWIGPRLGMLMMSLAPVIATLLAWAWLGERLQAVQFLAIAVTIGGVALVVLTRPAPSFEAPPNRDYARGLLFGLGAASGQAGGLILAKFGLAGDFPALSGNLMRMLTAAGVLWLATLVFGQIPATIRRLRGQPRAAVPLICGALTGPFLGVWLSLIAIQHTSIGVASTLMALPPVFLLPISRLVFAEQIGWRTILGTMVAISGVAMLFLA
jgi:drug/metabolite transporter (DMT)-like permease